MAVSAFIAAVIIAGLAQDPAQRDTLPPPGTVHGRLRTPGGEPVVRATIEALPAARRTTSDLQGSFRFSELPEGLVVLHVRALGFEPRYFQLQLGSDRGWRGQVTLQFAAQVLPDIIVHSPPGLWKPPEYAETHKYDDFFRRQHLGFGTFFDRETIQKRNATTLLELLQLVPGIHVSWNPPGSPRPTTVRMARCEGNPPNLAFYIDGNRIPITAGPPITAGGTTFGGGSPEGTNRAAERFEETLNSVHPREIEMMEIYRGVAQIPDDLDRDVCAAIVIWTRYNR